MQFAVMYRRDEDSWWSDPEWCDSAEEAIDYIKSREEDADEPEYEEDEEDET